ncbi:MAG: hypothetical protein WEA08_09380, partial [Woeseia sp.]
ESAISWQIPFRHCDSEMPLDSHLLLCARAELPVAERQETAEHSNVFGQGYRSCSGALQQFTIIPECLARAH